MEVIFELVFEFVFQVLIEGLFDLGFRGAGKLLSNRLVRWVLGTVSAAALAYGGGWWWGNRLADQGQSDMPSSFYVSIGLAVAFGALAIARAVRGRRQDTFEVSISDLFDEPAESIRLLSPVHWSAWRLVGFCFVNLAVAAGIDAGFTPEAVPLG